MKIEKVEKLLANLYDKTKNVIQIKNLKYALNHGLILKKVQKDWLKPYIKMNIELRQKAKYNFYKDFFKLMNNAILGIKVENVRKYRFIKLVTSERKRNYVVSGPKSSYYKVFHRSFIRNINEKIRNTYE